MPYVKKRVLVDEEIKAWKFLVREFGLSMREAQRAVDRKRLYMSGSLVERKSQLISGEIDFLIYEPSPKGLLPIYENEFFALFEKPSGVLTHPRNRQTDYSLNDEIKHLYGKGANVVHRLDRETSGLIVVSKSKEYEGELKSLFESREVDKRYLALVNGKIEAEFMVDEPISINSEYDLIKLKVHIDKSGKRAKTSVVPLKYYEDIDATLIEAAPKTGRQHQIRVHMFHVEHTIIGDPLYGQSSEDGATFLDGIMSKERRVELTRASRLLLHAHKISFNFRGVVYNFVSQEENNFYHLVKKGKK